MIQKVSIIVPTRHRYEKLIRMIRSLPRYKNYDRFVRVKGRNIPIELLVICDGDKGSYDRLQENQFLLGITLVANTLIHRGSVYCRNLMIQRVEDALIYATDDIVFRRGSIESAIRSMEKHFPDGDGIIGFNQENARKFSPAGVALVGRKFLDRYPKRQLFYPEYKHFACQEIARLGEITGRIYIDFNAKVWHDHPAMYKESMDRTHRDARKWRQADLRISTARKKLNLTWGRND